MVSLTINNRVVEVPEGITLLEAARQTGVHIPTLCYHKAMKPYGGCRLCLVEVTQGDRTQLTTSCTYPASEGLKVVTDSEEVLEARRLIIDLLWSRCPEVPELAEIAQQLGVTEPSFSKGQDDCILCGKCTRVCSELQKVGAISFMGRGAKRQVTTPFGEFSEVCRTCGACAFVCPTGHIKNIGEISGKIPKPLLSSFNAGLGTRGNIYRLYPQAVPSTPAIDQSNCVKLLTGDCGACAQICPTGAIDYEQKGKTVSLEVGALILAPGFRPFDARLKPEYGYDRYPNVINSLQFERLLSATGPYGGHVKRPSDGAEPQKIAWIQCVGSRDASIGREYCSYVCCMYAAKQTVIAKEHHPGIEPTVFFIDFRAQGKGFDRYYERARGEHGVRFIRAMVSRVTEDPRTQDLELTFVDEDGRLRTETFHLVVLSVGLTPHPATKKLAAVCEIETDQWGFVKSPPFMAVETSKPGIYTCGVYQSPKDIPETVGQASAAAGAASTLLSEVRGTLLSKFEYPPERDVAQEEPRIGVFICHCGVNIAGVVDVAQVTEYARTLPGVAYADHYTFSCATDSLEAMRQVIMENRLNRVVVASCSPRTHEPLFQENLRKAGLNKYLFEMANIRDQDSWVHQGDPEAATAKAKELVKMAVGSATALESLHDVPVPVKQRALVVGGGLGGLVAALTIADAGYQVYLPEIQERFGGSLANKMRYTLEGHAIKPFMEDLVRRLEGHPNIRWWPDARMTSFSGHVGNFRSKLESPTEQWEIFYGAAVIALGAVEYQPREYLYGENSRVLTQTEMENLTADSPDLLGESPTVVMIQCVGSREPEHQYCSRTCCGEAIKNALTIKRLRPQARVFILYRDIRTYGLKELYYKKARDLGVQFIRFEPERRPEVSAAGEVLKISVFDQNLKTPIELQADYLVLSAAIRPHPASRDIANLFKLPLDADGFFMEAHMKLRPLDFASSGIFLCGLAHSPKYFEEGIAQAQGAAARALGVLAQEQMYLGGPVACVDPQKCVICLTCVRTCPFGVPRVDQYQGVVAIEPAACQGCGSCASACPRKAIQVRHYRDKQYISKICAIEVEEVPEDQAAS